MIEKVSNIVGDGNPLYVQFAKNRDYEHGWKVDFTSGSPSDKEIMNFLSGRIDICSFEVYFKTAGEVHLYFGVNYTKKFASDFIEFYKKTITGIWGQPGGGFQSVIQNLSRQFLGVENGLMSKEQVTDIIFLVVDYWKTFGDKTIWKKGDSKILSKKEMYIKLAELPELLSNDKNYTGLEYLFDNNTHWLSFQVSTKINQSWVLERNRVEDILQNLSGLTLIS